MLETDDPLDPRWKDRVLMEVPNSPTGHPFYYYDDEERVANIWGAVCRTIFDGWDAALYRFSRRESDRFFDFRIEDALRISLLGALTFNVDFDGSDVGLDLPWESPEASRAEFDGRGWAWAKLTSGLGAEAATVDVLDRAHQYLELMLPVGAATSGRRDEEGNAPAEPGPPSQEQSLSSQRPSAELSECVSAFRKNGEAWEVEYLGLRTCLNHRQGLEFLCYILRNPNRKIDVVEIESGGRVRNIQSSEPQAAMDEIARAQLTVRLGELENSTCEDPAEAVAAREEARSIQDRLNADTGKRGKPRAIPNEIEKTRGRVAKGIEAGMQALERWHPLLYEHLIASTDNLAGRWPHYRPEPLVLWQTEKPPG